MRDLSKTSLALGGISIYQRPESFRLNNATSACEELFEMSLYELSWSHSVAQDPYGKTKGTGDVNADLMTWVSAVLANLDTCLEGFNDVIESHPREFISRKINQISPKVYNLLSMVKPMTARCYPKIVARNGGRKNAFPWLKLLEISKEHADLIVSKDGSGNFSDITPAIESAPNESQKPFLIYVKKGTYHEYVSIREKKWNIVLIGDGMGETVITGSHGYVSGWTTFITSTFAVNGRGFTARDLTIENTAGAGQHQAVALRSDSDSSVLYRCEIRGYQDTLYAHSQRQFYRECKISGTVDFIFGDAPAVFQNSQILARKGLPGQQNVLTAQGRVNSSEVSGFSFQFCNISADPELLPTLNSTDTFLGRPWRPYSRTVFMQSYLSNIVSPGGWIGMGSDAAFKTLYYGEYLNTGPGASTDKRVNWPGHHVLNDTNEASSFTVSNLITGDTWLPATGVPFIAGFK
ncbi:hypothetical protein ACFE04_019212 [Oxalis oulophora]